LEYSGLPGRRYIALHQKIRGMRFADRRGFGPSVHLSQLRACPKLVWIAHHLEAAEPLFRTFLGFESELAKGMRTLSRRRGWPFWRPRVRRGFERSSEKSVADQGRRQRSVRLGIRGDQLELEDPGAARPQWAEADPGVRVGLDRSRSCCIWPRSSAPSSRRTWQPAPRR
jgi:hypothetical protein